ncbi:MAG TPA: aromatic amino acid transport family protein [Gammaproteobacteria bacterium]|jgi:tyrosine-specific transport protein|nr:aromatic amino acid transport family protein [Gammaproteobacteria bacterium]
MNVSVSFKSVFGATMLIAGCCIGAGMIGLPVRSALAGFMPSTVAMVLCCAFTTITGLLILEATLWFDKKVNFATIAESILGKKAKLITLFLFLALFYSLSVAYLDGGGIIFADIFSAITGYAVPRSVGIAFCTVLVAGITYAGTHMVNRLNQLLMLGLVVTYILLMMVGVMHASVLHVSHSNVLSTLNVIPIMLICFGYQNLVPTVTYYLNKNVKHIRLAIIMGNLIPLFVYMLWNYVILSILPADISLVKNAEIVTQLLENTVPLISIVLLVKSFSLFALLTSFIPNSISLVDFVKDGVRHSFNNVIENDVVCLCVVFIPSFLFTISYPHLFLNMLEFAGGFIDVLLFGVLPAMIILMGRKTMTTAKYQVSGGMVTPIFVLIFSSIVLLLKLRVFYA